MSYRYTYTYLIWFDYQAPEELLTELLHGEQNVISEIILEHLTTNLARNYIKRIAQPSRITQCRLSQYLSHCKFIILDEWWMCSIIRKCLHWLLFLLQYDTLHSCDQRATYPSKPSALKALTISLRQLSCVKRCELWITSWEAGPCSRRNIHSARAERCPELPAPPLRFLLATAVHSVHPSPS